MEANTIKQVEMKEKIMKEYLRRTRKLFETKLYCNIISHEKTWTWLKKGNLKRKTESFIAAQNNTARTNHIKERIDKTQHNSRCSLYGDRDETTNPIICKSSKLAQKEYKTRHDWVGMVIHRKLCNKLMLDPTNKWYMRREGYVPQPCQRIEKTVEHKSNGNCNWCS